MPRFGAFSLFCRTFGKNRREKEDFSLLENLCLTPTYLGKNKTKCENCLYTGCHSKTSNNKSEVLNTDHIIYLSSKITLLQKMLLFFYILQLEQDSKHLFSSLVCLLFMKMAGNFTWFWYKIQKKRCIYEYTTHLTTHQFKLY